MKKVKNDADLEESNEATNLGKTLPNGLRVHFKLRVKLIYVDAML